MICSPKPSTQLRKRHCEQSTMSVYNTGDHLGTLLIYCYICYVNFLFEAIEHRGKIGTQTRLVALATSLFRRTCRLPQIFSFYLSTRFLFIMQTGQCRHYCAELLDASKLSQNISDLRRKMLAILRNGTANTVIIFSAVIFSDLRQFRACEKCGCVFEQWHH